MHLIIYVKSLRYYLDTGILFDYYIYGYASSIEPVPIDASADA